MIKNKSIKTNLKTFFVILIGILIGFILFDRCIDSIEIKLQDDFVSRSIKVGDLYSQLYWMDILLAEYRQDEQLYDYESYIKKSEKFGDDIEYLNVICSEEIETMNYLRRIETFNNYQISLFAKKNISQLDRYKNLSFINTAIDDQKTHAQELIAVDLIITRNQYRNNMKNLRCIQLLILLITILIIFLVIFFYAERFKKIIKSISLMQENINELKNKNWNIEDLSVCDYEEIDNITVAINEMKHEIRSYFMHVNENNRLEQELQEERLNNSKKEKALLIAKMESLKSQVNPHFLFNTLNMISKSAWLNQPELTAELIEATAKIMRNLLKPINGQVTLSQEIDIIETYLYIQKMRFDDLEYSINIEPELKGEKVPSMIIQPILENCFKHGYVGESRFYISIEIIKKFDTIIINVEDNGQGFDINNLVKKDGQHIGINNIKERLYIEYNEEDLITISSKLNKGTKVSIFIPTNKKV